jgi:hypothetical protein
MSTATLNPAPQAGSFLDLRTGRRIAYASLPELRHRVSAMLAELGRDRPELLQETYMPCFLLPDRVAGVIDVAARPRPLAGVDLIASRP